MPTVDFPVNGSKHFVKAQIGIIYHSRNGVAQSVFAVDCGKPG